MGDTTEILVEDEDRTVLFNQDAFSGDDYVEQIRKQYPDLIILEKLGRGSYGAVYRCVKTDTGTGLQTGFAIKVVEITARSAEAENTIAKEGITPEIYCERKRDDAISEIRLLNELKSPHIVHINDFDVVEKKDEIGFIIFIKMDVLTPLSSLLKDCESYTKKDAEKIGRKLCADMCDALKVCESHKIIHRDIKPENIFYSRTENKIDFYLGDFGIARVLEETEVKMTAIGTVSYAAPEVFMLKNYDNRADFYSLGIVLYQVVNHGRLPFMPRYPQQTTIADSTNAQSMRLNPNAKLEAPDNASSKLAAVITKLCAFAPDNRYRTVEDILMGLNDGKAVIVVDGNDVPIKENIGLKVISLLLLLAATGAIGFQIFNSVKDMLNTL